MKLAVDHKSKPGSLPVGRTLGRAVADGKEIQKQTKTLLLEM